MKNILFISSQFPNVASPTNGVFSLQLVRQMSAMASISVISPVPTLGRLSFINSLKNYKTADVPAKTSIDGITVYHPAYMAMPKLGYLHASAMYKTLLPLVASLHKARKIDAVNCHWIFPDGVAVQKICAELNIPVMLTALGTDINYYTRFFMRRKAISRALAGAGKVSVLNSDMFDKCLKLGVKPEKLVVIPNGIDLEKFKIIDKARCRTRLKMPLDGKAVLFIGSLVPVKGVESLINAFAILLRNQKQTPVKLYLIGQGHLESRLKAMASSLKIEGDVRFVGPVAHESLSEWLNAADCLCLPSVNEGHPNVMMEALATGTPVVGSAVGSIPDFINRATGFLTAPSDENDIADKLAACLATSYKKEAVRARVQDYSWTACASRYMEELRGIMGPAREQRVTGLAPVTRLSR